MILRAFDVKFDEKKDELPPRACRPLKKSNKNNVDNVDHQKVEKNNVEHVGSYILIYLHIPPYTPTYNKTTVNIRPTNGHNSGPRVSPMARIWHAPYYHIVKGFFTPKGPQFELNQMFLKVLGGS